LFRGRATITPGDDLTTRSWQELMPKGCKARPEQVILFTVSAWDSNCPQHIPQRFEAADVAAALAQRDERIVALEANVRRLATRSAASNPKAQRTEGGDASSPSRPK
jgi:hypothetical protein